MFLILLFMAVLILGVFQQAGAQPAADVPKNDQASVPAQPMIWYGLLASLAGTVVFWSSVLIMARRRAR